MTKKLNKKTLTLLVSALLFFSCQGNKEEKSKPLARVGNTYITRKYFEDKIMEFGDFDYLKTKIGRKQFLDILINEQLIKLASANSSIKSSKLYKERIKKIEEEMKRRLEENKDAILIKMWLEKLRENELMVNEKEINDYLATNKYSVSFEQVITTDYEIAQSIFNEMKKGVSIELLAKKYKDNENVVFNKIPSVIKGELINELDDMVFKMKNGEIGGIIKTKLGYHIIKKTSEVPINTKNDTIKEKVKKVLEKKKFDNYILTLQEKYKVEVLDEDYK
jgi:peptidyl-prolyl cis-trans isomerase C